MHKYKLKTAGKAGARIQRVFELPSYQASKTSSSCGSFIAVISIPPQPLYLFVTSLRTAVETAISEVHQLLPTGGVLTSFTLLFRRWLTVSSVFAGGSARTSYSLVPPPPPPPSPSLISLMVSEDVKQNVYLLTTYPLSPPLPPPPSTPSQKQQQTNKTGYQPTSHRSNRL